MARHAVIQPDRTEEILNELLRTGAVSVSDLVRQLNVSPATVRRALRSLERQGLLRRTHGGAVPLEPPQPRDWIRRLVRDAVRRDREGVVRPDAGDGHRPR